jgi:hypothetical protein
MSDSNALERPPRHLPWPLGWAEVVVGYDFGILSIQEIQAWAKSLAAPGQAVARLASLQGIGLVRFEEALWAACREGTGCRVPRPGHQRWAVAQDLWRTALLKEVLAAPLSQAAFAEAVEAIVDQVGGPEDMLGLLQRGSGRPFSADRAQAAAFVRNLEMGFATSQGAWPGRAAS